MRRWLALSVLVALACATLPGCDTGNEPVRTAPGTDTRSVQEKETELLMQKSQQEYNKRVR